MKIWNTLKRINIKSSRKLLVLSIQYPHFLYPTFLATKECMRVSTLHFGREHFRNTPANAFRHALWNYLIAYYCAKWSTDKSKLLRWTKAITDWHENAFVNKKLPRLMDFHNNDVGRTVYLQNTASNVEAVIQGLMIKTRNAIQVKTLEAISSASGNLVYLYPPTKVTT